MNSFVPVSLDDAKLVLNRPFESIACFLQSASYRICTQSFFISIIPCYFCIECSKYSLNGFPTQSDCTSIAPLGKHNERFIVG